MAYSEGFRLQANTVAGYVADISTVFRLQAQTIADYTCEKRKRYSTSTKENLHESLGNLVDEAKSSVGVLICDIKSVGENIVNGIKSSFYAEQQASNLRNRIHERYCGIENESMVKADSSNEQRPGSEKQTGRDPKEIRRSFESEYENTMLTSIASPNVEIQHQADNEVTTKPVDQRYLICNAIVAQQSDSTYRGNSEFQPFCGKYAGVSKSNPTVLKEKREQKANKAGGITKLSTTEHTTVLLYNMKDQIRSQYLKDKLNGTTVPERKGKNKKSLRNKARLISTALKRKFVNTKNCFQACVAIK